MSSSSLSETAPEMPTPDTPDDEDGMESLDFCVHCLESFRYDDVGGYNPPCSCGLHCRDCHDAAMRDNAAYDDDDYYDEPEPRNDD